MNNMSNKAAVIRLHENSVFSKVAALISEIATRATEIEKNCAVPMDLLEKVEATGAFRMALSAHYGGGQMSVSEVCEVIEKIAAVDASVAWHLMIAIGSQYFTARLPRETLDTYYAAGPDTWSKGALAPKGLAVPVEGGYRLSGRWPLASGAREFKWVSVGFFIRDENGLRKGADGKQPDFRIGLVSHEHVKVIPTWDAVGLRGTRSDDLEMHDVFIAEDRQGPLWGPSNIDAPLYRIRLPVATDSYHGAVLIGAVKAALVELATNSLDRKPAFNPAVLMRDEPVFKSRFGELAVRFDALEALYRQCIATLDMCAAQERDVTEQEAAKLGAANALLHHECPRIMDEIIDLSGSGSIYMTNIQQRRWRDVRCVAQHQSGNISLYAAYAESLVDTSLQQSQVG
ncbi:acyl-CoA dehydrogenase family protein [Pseudomonas sp. Z18(2022)]|uniref:acyl-CoA dehydrogenase family protein n=1 Tax=Pseudomonas sp. Z18(2022) TaxID=2983410 RepID=UPI002E81670C|nr:acyl-CoA dehydrogenase family protein [Pseudomonas sp. Z18(2022)]